MGKKNFTGSNVKYWACVLLDDGTMKGCGNALNSYLKEYRPVKMFEAAELKHARDYYLKEIKRIQAEYDQ